MSWRHQRVFITRVLSGERIGLVEIGEERYRVYYGPLILGEFDGCDRTAETVFYTQSLHVAVRY